MIKPQPQRLQNALHEHIVSQQHLPQHDRQHRQGKRHAVARQVDAADADIRQQQQDRRRKAQQKRPDQPQPLRGAAAVCRQRVLDRGVHCVRALLTAQTAVCRALLPRLFAGNALLPAAAKLLFPARLAALLGALRVRRALRQRLALIAPDLRLWRHVLVADGRKAQRILRCRLRRRVLGLCFVRRGRFLHVRVLRVRFRLVRRRLAPRDVLLRGLFLRLRLTLAPATKFVQNILQREALGLLLRSIRGDMNLFVSQILRIIFHVVTKNYYACLCRTAS